MDVSCPACAARYTADDEKLRGKTARMRCKACNTVWLVSGGPQATSAAAHPRVESDSTSKRAAVVRKGAEREKRDLFAQQDPVEGSVKETLLPPPSFGFTGVGARNENSVLFRVDQLTAAARLKTPEPSPAAAVEASSSAPSSASSGGADDEGIIDLKALASAPPRKIGLPVAPLFSEPPAVSLDVNETAQRPVTKPASKLRLIGGIAAAAAFLLVTGLGVSLAFKGEEPVEHAAAAIVEPPAPAVTEPPKVEPAPVASAEDTSDAKDDNEVATDVKSKKKGKGKKGKGKGKAAKSGTITNKTPPPAPKKVKPADPCGCKGDFNCILACTAKRGK